MDLVKLDMPPFDAEKHKCLTSSKCANPEPSAYPDNPVFTAVNTKFSEEAPTLTAFLAKVSVPLPVINETLAHMEESGDDSSTVAKWFLKNKPDVWTKWVPADASRRFGACRPGQRESLPACRAASREKAPCGQVALGFFPWDGCSPDARVRTQAVGAVRPAAWTSGLSDYPAATAAVSAPEWSRNNVS
ncbi:hypothetical protein G6F65_019454 [Rhizopus arrhizus]|nr:hypothetical protein G6F65_019454 [Rhizopus arrhizus]